MRGFSGPKMDWRVDRPLLVDRQVQGDRHQGDRLEAREGRDNGQGSCWRRKESTRARVIPLQIWAVCTAVADQPATDQDARGSAGPTARPAFGQTRLRENPPTGKPSC